MRTVMILLLVLSRFCLAADESWISVTDSESGVSFQYPKDYKISHTDIMVAPETGVTSSTNLMFWYVYNTSYHRGSIQDRARAYGGNLVAADGPEGGAQSEAQLLETVRAKSGDHVLVFELKIRAHGNSAPVDGRKAGYLLAVDLRPSTMKYRNLIIYVPKRDHLLRIAQTINVPTAVSLK